MQHLPLNHVTPTSQSGDRMRFTATNQNAGFNIKFLHETARLKSSTENLKIRKARERCRSRDQNTAL